MDFLFVVRYGVRKGNPPWWSTIAVAAGDEREARSIGLVMAARHKTDILGFDLAQIRILVQYPPLANTDILLCWTLETLHLPHEVQKLLADWSGEAHA